MSNREFITLQLGNFSNHVGTHWWNIQQSLSSFRNFNQTNEDDIEDDSQKDNKISHDVMWRSGENHKGQVTYTPRAIMLDEKSNLGTMSQTGGALYDENIENFESSGRNLGNF